MKLHKYWYLGLLGLVGIYQLPAVINVFKGHESAWALLGLLWLLWFDYLIPKTTKK